MPALQNFETTPKSMPVPKAVLDQGAIYPAKFHKSFKIEAKQTSARPGFSKQAMRNLSIQDQILFERFGQGAVSTVPYTCIHHPFEVQAIVNPQSIAAEHLDDSITSVTSITYRELNRQANRLATILQAPDLCRCSG